jgi:hypothetical protein
MSDYQHVQTTFSDEAPVSADDWMMGAADWAEHVNFFIATLPLKCTKSVYAPGAKKGQFPLTRHVTVDKSVLSKEDAAAIPDIFPETLVWFDATARMLLYRIEGEPWGMRNYFAFNEVEPLGPDKCKVTFSSRFDLPPGFPADAMLPGFHTAYKAMIAGIAGYAKSKKKAA